MGESARAGAGFRILGSSRHARRAAYWAVFAGALGHIYGHNLIWQMHAPPRKPILDAKLTWREALDAPSAKQVGYWRGLIEFHPTLDRVPDQSLLVDGPSEGAAHRRATRGRDYAFISTPDGAPMEVRLSVIAGQNVHASWFSPRTGETTAIGKFENRGQRAFDPRGETKPGNDGVLVRESHCNGNR